MDTKHRNLLLRIDRHFRQAMPDAETNRRFWLTVKAYKARVAFLDAIPDELGWDRVPEDALMRQPRLLRPA